MKLTEKTLSSKCVYRGSMINLRVDQVELPDGKPSQREIVEHPGAVAVVALTRNQELVMVRQYRKPIDKAILEIPAGKLNRGEEPSVCAQRELLEETGYRAGQLSLITRYYTTPGFSDEVMYLYLARELEELAQSPDEDEFIEMIRIPLATAQKMVLTGDIQDAKTLIGILALNKLLT